MKMSPLTQAIFAELPHCDAEGNGRYRSTRCVRNRAEHPLILQASIRQIAACLGHLHRAGITHRIYHGRSRFRKPSYSVKEG